MDAPLRTRNRARRLRRQLTYTEAVLWIQLRRGGLGGLHFRKQHPFGRYVLDFYCDSARLAVEVDGGIHELACNQAQDAERDRWLAEQRIRVLRIPANWVVSYPNRVGAMILAAAAQPVELPWARTVSPQ
jgi:very-short-patch-repair endonuclease